MAIKSNKSFYCSICKANFTRKEHLDRHLRSHNDEKPFVCSNCGKGFGRKDLLTRHNKCGSCLKSSQQIPSSIKNGLQTPKKVQRCQSACQACINSKCRCVKSNDDIDSCDRCTKRNILCVSRKVKKSNSQNKTEVPLSEAADEDNQDKDFEYVAGAETLLKLSNSRSIPNKALVIKDANFTQATKSINLTYPSNPANSIMGNGSGNIKKILETSPLCINAILSPAETFFENSNITSEQLERQNTFMNNPTSRITSIFSISPGADKSSLGSSINQNKLMENSNTSNKQDDDLFSEETTITKDAIFPNGSNFLEHSYDQTANANLPECNEQEHSKIQKAPAGIDEETTANEKNSNKADQSEQQEDINASNITQAFSYYGNEQTDHVSDTSPGLDLINKFDFNGVLNSIRDILQAVDDKGDSFSDILDNWIYEQKVNNGDDTNLEMFFNYDDLEFSIPDNIFLSNGNDKNDYIDNNGGSSKSPYNLGDNERREARGSVFSDSSIIWKSPRHDSSSKDVRPFTDRRDKILDYSSVTIDQSSDLFKRFEILPETRDAILIMLSETHQMQFWRDGAIVHLPSVDKLTVLIINYFQYFQTRYQIIHMPSFNPNSIPIVLLITILGTGSFFCGIENETMKKTGRYLLEISRRRLILEFEENNSKIRHIELHQASLINYICGSWSGIDRNVEIAASFTSTIVTMIRRGELFKRYTYKTLQSIVEDPKHSTVETKWQAWIEMESKKMLVFVMFFWSAQFSLLSNNPYYITYAELELPLPHLESLWKASTADEWFKVVKIIKNKNSQHYSQNMSFQLLIGSVLSSIYSPAKSVSPKYIPDIIIGSLISTVKHFISEINDRLSFTNCIPGMTDNKKRKRHLLSLDATFHLSYLTNRKAEIETMLESLESFISNNSYNDKVVFKLEIEYSFICLHSCVKDCMKFAGVDGEYESRQTLPRLIQWFKRDSARITSWHCAQILRLANSAITKKICK
ncbi:uncharacterized protein AC631_03441 [Debaryomyces fabryi]|uniref:C2H2-type domain-containing protein n=1 Tax=Debaryomyces fabryi TaxID=58627 RepID=A0A0V1PX23_9ASCO|nr:uncharacterized protein AC631_03441 [Debaryomyces fabryi]KSA00792.1 hypothetical protein AC631_03441 [Debaryomyces fabryi]CUM55123.1 unnamed protein product [Debaryomyces fabryi]